jgi:hypothetical protein
MESFIEFCVRVVDRVLRENEPESLIEFCVRLVDGVLRSRSLALEKWEDDGGLS